MLNNAGCGQMQKTLLSLFDFQRFAQNPKLERMIVEAEQLLDAQESQRGEISEDELELVHAAGDLLYRPKRPSDGGTDL